MRFRTGVLILAALAAALIAPPVAQAGAPPGVHATVDSVHRVPLTVQAAPESVRIYLVTQLVIPDSLGRDSVRLHAHVQRGVTALVVGLTTVNVPVHSGMVFQRDHDVPVVSPTRCRDSVLSELRRRDHASWAARTLPPNRPALLRYARR